MLRRRFVDLPWGQMHVLVGGHGGVVPLILLHGAGGNARMMAPLVRAMAATREVFTPDLPGCGDSDALPDAQPDVARIAMAVFEGLDALGLAQCDVYGAHLGARVAMELALLAPTRIRRLILDGIGFYDEAGRQAMLDQVAPIVVPDAEGAYLHTAHAMCRDYFRYFPWFARNEVHRRAAPPPDPEAVHAKLLEVLRNGRTYGVPYHAALRYRAEDRLPLLHLPVLLATNRQDNVAPQAARAAGLLPGAATALTPGAANPAAAMETATIFARFLDAPPADVHPPSMLGADP